MIKYTTGNIIESNAEALVNTVNTVGVMGKGIALAFKKAFPENYKIYREAFKSGQLNIGELLITTTNQLSPKYIINFPTKKHWRERSEMNFVETGMKALVKEIRQRAIKSVAIPPLGCGNGGLKWEKVKPLILRELEAVQDDVEVIIYEPGFNNQEVVQSNKKVALTPARAMLLTALKNYQILGYDINLLVIQKIAYFLQRFGEPLNLDYEKGYYGPYAHKLQHLINHLNGFYLHFDQEKNKPGTPVTLKHFEKVEAYNREHLTDVQRDRLEKVQRLTEGFESPYGLELLATVDFILQREPTALVDQLIVRVGEWTKRKKQIMKPFHVKVAHQRLSEYYRTHSL